jgi:hypothetical protein
MRGWAYRTLLVLTLLATLLVAAPANGNGGRSALSLHVFRARVITFAETGWRVRWGVTVCTARGARLRISAALEDYVELDTFERVHWVRRQPAGCRRHILRAVCCSEIERTDTRLRVAWKERVRYTPALTLDFGGPD